MMNYLSRVWSLVLRHIFLSACIALVALWGGWYLWGKATSTTGKARYALGAVARGTIVSSITGSGQVASSQLLDLKPRASGQVISITVSPGDTIYAGQLLAILDPTAAQKSVRDAQTNLDSAILALQKLQKPATTLTVTQQQNALTQAQSSLLNQYQSIFSDITSTFLDLSTIISALQSINLGNDVGGNQWNIDYYSTQASRYNLAAQSYRDKAYNDYNTARLSYNKTFADFNALSSTPDQAAIEKMLAETKTTSSLVATAAKSSYDLIQFYSDQLTQNDATPKSAATTQIANLNSYQTKMQSHLSALLSDITALANSKSDIVERQQTLDQTMAGADQLDVQSAQLTITQRRNALEDAQNALADYYVRAPFAGTVAAVTVHKYDQAGSGSSIVTLVTTQQLAELSLNEVDAAKIKLGNKATLTFDAIAGLTLTGKVVEIDPVGTVTQGVVSYDVKIALDAQNAQIKSGMTANATIQTGVKQDVLYIPQSAVKTASGQKYVLVFIPPIATSTAATAGSSGVLSKTPPVQVPVEVGFSDDTNIEVVSGLTEGEQIVTRTITGIAATAAPISTRGGGVGGVRIP